MRETRQAPANLHDLHSAKAALAKAIQERDDARAKAPDIMGDSQATRDAQATIVKLQGERFTLQGHLAEARNEIASLERSLAKARPAPIQAPGVTETLVSVPTPVPAPIVDPSASFWVKFRRFPGYDVVARLRALQGRWDALGKVWVMPALSTEVERYLHSLQSAGVEFSTERSTPDSIVRDPGEDSADRWNETHRDQ